MEFFQSTSVGKRASGRVIVYVYPEKHLLRNLTKHKQNFKSEERNIQELVQIK